MRRLSLILLILLILVSTSIRAAIATIGETNLTFTSMVKLVNQKLIAELFSVHFEMLELQNWYGFRANRANWSQAFGKVIYILSPLFSFTLLHGAPYLKNDNVIRTTYCHTYFKIYRSGSSDLWSCLRK